LSLLVVGAALQFSLRKDILNLPGIHGDSGGELRPNDTR